MKREAIRDTREGKKKNLIGRIRSKDVLNHLIEREMKERKERTQKTN